MQAEWSAPSRAGYTLPASVPNSSNASRFDNRWSPEPCSSGAVSTPSSPLHAPGVTDQAATSKVSCAEYTSASSTAATRVHDAARFTRRRSTARWVRGSSGRACVGRCMERVMAVRPHGCKGRTA
jgi:hypothetical protein